MRTSPGLSPESWNLMQFSPRYLSKPGLSYLNQDKPVNCETPSASMNHSYPVTCEMPLSSSIHCVITKIIYLFSFVLSFCQCFHLFTQGNLDTGRENTIIIILHEGLKPREGKLYNHCNRSNHTPGCLVALLLGTFPVVFMNWHMNQVLPWNEANRRQLGLFPKNPQDGSKRFCTGL